MSEEKQAYRGSEITIRSESGSQQLLIDGVPVPFSAVEGEDAFQSPHTPFVKHRSLLDLAKAVVDHRLR